MNEESRTTRNEPQQKRMPDLQQGTYSDGHPLDELHNVNHAQGGPLHVRGELRRIVRRTAEAPDVDYSTEGFKGLRPQKD